MSCGMIQQVFILTDVTQLVSIELCSLGRYCFLKMPQILLIFCSLYLDVMFASLSRCPQKVANLQMLSDSWAGGDKWEMPGDVL